MSKPNGTLKTTIGHHAIEYMNSRIATGEYSGYAELLREALREHKQSHQERVAVEKMEIEIKRLQRVVLNHSNRLRYAGEETTND